MFPTREEGLAFHDRLMAPDATASRDVVLAYLGPLTTFLRGIAAPWTDSTFVHDAAVEALMNYVVRPTRFDPSRLDLAAWLKMAAKGDFFNLLRREAKHHRNRAGPVELGAVAGNDAGAASALDRLVGEEAADAAQADADRTWSDEERECLRLIRDGERRTAVFASALGLAGLAPADQERRVKQVKDRVKRRLARRGKTDG